MSTVPQNPSRRGARRLLSPISLCLLVCVLSLGIIGVFGGWERVAEGRSNIVTLRPGETVTAHPFMFTPIAAYWTTNTKSPYFTPENTRLLVTVMEMEVVERFPVSPAILSDDLTCDAPGIRKSGSNPELARQRTNSMFRTIDTYSPGFLPPGLKQQITLTWAQDLSAPIPDTLTLTIPSYTWREHSGGLGRDWFDPTPTARVTLPLEELTSP